eukprot:Hpha_TRINITY_DN15436_c0_g1::TRINITY_DN15436_c0_g1_i1::g.172813::m.172813
MAGLVIFVERYGQKTAVELNPDATVETLAQAAGVPADSLSFQGQRITDPSQCLADLGMCQQSTVSVEATKSAFCPQLSLGCAFTKDNTTAKKSRACQTRYALAVEPEPLPSYPGVTVRHVRVDGFSGVMAIAIGVITPNPETVYSEHGNGAGMIFADGKGGWAFVDNGKLLAAQEAAGAGRYNPNWGWSHPDMTSFERGSTVTTTITTDMDGRVKINYAVNGNPVEYGFDSAKEGTQRLQHPLYFGVSLETQTDTVTLVRDIDEARADGETVFDHDSVKQSR